VGLLYFPYNKRLFSLNAREGVFCWKELKNNMKKFISYAVIAASAAYYACLPFVIAQAGGTPIVHVATTATDSVLSVLSMRITAYTSVPEETDDTPFITADGSHVADGIAASNILPFGTRIKIPALFGDQVFTIHDRMSPRIKNTIDIWMPTFKEAWYFGAQKASILVLGEETSTPMASNPIAEK
jgi:3D (Asp-Asp-Asp) domain-containing protein